LTALAVRDEQRNTATSIMTEQNDFSYMVDASNFIIFKAKAGQ